VFVLDYLTGVRRNSAVQLKSLEIRNRGNPAAAYFLNQARLEGRLTDKLYSLVPADSNTPDTLPTVVEFKPNMSFFCIKDLKVNRLWKEGFEEIRPLGFYKEGATELQSLALIHFSPANILRRTKFRFAEQDKKTDDANKPAEPEGAV